jgi:hypothetical protein
MKRLFFIMFVFSLLFNSVADSKVPFLTSQENKGYFKDVTISNDRMMSIDDILRMKEFIEERGEYLPLLADMDMQAFGKYDVERKGAKTVLYLFHSMSSLDIGYYCEYEGTNVIRRGSLSAWDVDYYLWGRDSERCVCQNNYNELLLSADQSEAYFKDARVEQKKTMSDHEKSVIQTHLGGYNNSLIRKKIGEENPEFDGKFVVDKLGVRTTVYLYKMEGLFSEQFYYEYSGTNLVLKGFISGNVVDNEPWREEEKVPGEPFDLFGDQK